MANRGLFDTVRACRQFFMNRDYWETPTPPLVSNPGMEAHLHPFKVESFSGHNSSQDLYLHTSPEFHMKKLLSEGLEKIYHLGYCFRDEPSSHTHRPQFLMLEWYQAHSHYTTIKKETLELIEYVRQELIKKGYPVRNELPQKNVTVNELFQTYLGFSITDFLEVKELSSKIKKDFSHLLKDEENSKDWPWEDYFYLLFLNEIEPHFENFPLLIVDEFPAPLAALSTIKEDNPLVCERFEIYLSGVELCNCFNELTNLEEQKRRMRDEAKKKKELYGYELPEPKVLYEALQKGLPPSSGNALGVERLFLGLLNDSQEANPFFL